MLSLREWLSAEWTMLRGLVGDRPRGEESR